MQSTWRPNIKIIPQKLDGRKSKSFPRPVPYCLKRKLRAEPLKKIVKIEIIDYEIGDLVARDLFERKIESLRIEGLLHTSNALEKRSNAVMFGNSSGMKRLSRRREFTIL